VRCRWDREVDFDFVFDYGIGIDFDLDFESWAVLVAHRAIPLPQVGGEVGATPTWRR
jgi:hypothetical protein